MTRSLQDAAWWARKVGGDVDEAAHKLAAELVVLAARALTELAARKSHEPRIHRVCTVTSPGRMKRIGWEACTCVG